MTAFTQNEFAPLGAPTRHDAHSIAIDKLRKAQEELTEANKTIQFLKDAEALQAAKLEKLATELAEARADQRRLQDVANGQAFARDALCSEIVDLRGKADFMMLQRDTETAKHAPLKAAVHEFVEAHSWHDVHRTSRAIEALVALDKTP